MLKDLFEYTVLIDAEGRCENYENHGYVAADNWAEAYRYVLHHWLKTDIVIKATVKRTPIGLVDVAIWEDQNV